MTTSKSKSKDLRPSKRKRGAVFWILHGREPVPVINARAWADFIEVSGDGRRVADDHVEASDGRKVRVSTIFMGFDLNFYEPGAPLLFETCVFGGALDRTIWRYGTWEEAEQGHRALVGAAAVAGAEVVALGYADPQAPSPPDRGPDRRPHRRPDAQAGPQSHSKAG